MKILSFPQGEDRRPPRAGLGDGHRSAQAEDLAGHDSLGATPGTPGFGEADPDGIASGSRIVAALPHPPVSWTTRLHRADRALLALACAVLAATLFVSYGVHLRRVETRERNAQIAAVVRSLETILENSLETADEQRELDAAIPFGTLPGPILEDLRAAFRRAGLPTVRYAILPPPLPEDELESEDGTWAAADPRQAPAFADRLGDDTVDEAAFLEVTDDFDPAELARWQIALTTEAEFDRIVAFLVALRTQQRYWEIPRLEIVRGERALVAQLTVLTYLRPTDLAKPPSPAGTPPQPVVALDPVVDLFARTGHRNEPEPQSGAWVPEPAPGASIALPRLDAIRFGKTPRVMLDGVGLTVGDRSGRWTVAGIHPKGVTLRDDHGRTRILEVSDDARLP